MAGSRRATIGASLVALALGACVNPEPEWREVRDDAATRVGGDLHWERSEADVALIATRVAGLLDGGLTRTEAVQVALLNNRRLQAAFEEVGVADARVLQASLPTNPRLSYAFDIPLGGGRTAVEGGLLLFLSDVWLLPFRRGLEQARAEVTLRRVEGAVVEVATESAMAYNEVLFRAADLELARSALDLARDTAERTKVRYASGLSDDQEVYDAEARATERQILLAAAERDLQQARAELYQLLNLDDEQTVRGVSLLDALDADIDRQWTVDEAVGYALEHRLDLAAARLAIERAKTEVDLERALIFDNVQVGVEHEGKLGGGDQAVGPQVNLELPLFDQNQAQIARAEFRLRQAEKRLDAGIAQARRELVHVLAEIEYGRTHVRLFRTELQGQRSRAVAYGERFGNLMRLDWLHFLDARRAQVRSQRDYVMALWRLRDAETALTRALLGGGGVGRRLLGEQGEPERSRRDADEGGRERDRARPEMETGNDDLRVGERRG